MSIQQTHIQQEAMIAAAVARIALLEQAKREAKKES